MVFQQFYLFPHLTALETSRLVFRLRVRGANKEEAEKLARELLAKSVWQNVHITTLPNFLVVNSSVWRLPARWR